MMDTTDSSSTTSTNSSLASTSTLSSSSNLTSPSSSTSSSPSPLSQVQVLQGHSQSQSPVYSVTPGGLTLNRDRLTRMSMERRSSGAEGTGGQSPHGCGTSAAVLMMRRRVSSSCWSTNVENQNNNSSNFNNNNNNYNSGNMQGATTGSSGSGIRFLQQQSVSQTHLNPGATATAIRKEREQRLFPNNHVSTLVDDELSQMNLKRSSSAPMINQLGIQKEPDRFSHQSVRMSIGDSSLLTSSIGGNDSGCSRETSMDIDVASFTSSYLASLNNPRPRRFSASFCPPGSPGPAPSRVSQLRHENATDWEAHGEKEFLGTVSMAQSWEDLSLDPMEIGSRRPSISDQLWLSMPPGGSSASSSPAVSPRVLSRFSPSLSSPSPTRKSFTTRRSLSPIAVRPSVLTVGHGVKRKCDWDSSSSSSTNMDTSSPQPAPKRIGGLLSLSHGLAINSHRNSNNSSPTLHFASGSHHQLFHHIQPYRGSPNSLETGTESSISSISGGGGDSPFFRPVDSPMNSPSDLSDSPHSHRKN